MNLICITESELAQWVSRHYLDTLSARILTDRDSVGPDIFFTSPYLKLEDARGRIIVNLKDNWKELSVKLNTAKDIHVISIPIDAVLEISPAMDQYAKKLTTYKLPIAQWSVEKIWDKWLIDKAVMETHRAIVLETSRIGCLDKELIHNQELMNAVIQKSIRPKVVLANESITLGWAKILENRDTWIQWVRTEGHLDRPSMLKASAQKICKDFEYQSPSLDFVLSNEDRGWKIQDITIDIFNQFKKFELENSNISTQVIPPLFCIVAYLRLYDEIHNGDKDWRVVFNLLRFTKYSINSKHADVLTVSLLASLKADEIYGLRMSDIYMN